MNVDEWVGRTVEDPPGDVVCERGAIVHWCEATQNANAIFWDDDVAKEITAGPIAPPSMLSAWMRPLTWSPGRLVAQMPLSLHFELKEAFRLPEGIVTANEICFGVPVRLGDRIRTTQQVREIGDERTSRLGTGRDWTIEVVYRNQRGDVAGIETYRMFAYRRVT